MKLTNILLPLMIGILSCQAQTKTAPHPILETIKTGNLTKVKQFLEDKEDINATYAGYTLLCAAVKTNQKEITSYLLENEANVNKMSNKKTPLMYAAKYGRLEIAKILIQKGADKKTVSSKGRTALDYAHRYEKPNLIVLLSE
ncbi:MAG: ankyrin repeat domain-containing protein [Saprospiraceae bacterium]